MLNSREDATTSSTVVSGKVYHTSTNSAKEWVKDNPDKIDDFKKAYADKSLTTGDIAKMFSLPFNERTDRTATSPIVSYIAQHLECPPRAIRFKDSGESTSYEEVESLRKKENDLKKLTEQQARAIKKVVRECGGVLAFEAKYNELIKNGSLKSY